MTSIVPPPHSASYSPHDLADYWLMSDRELDTHLPTLLTNRAVSSQTAVFVLDVWLARRQIAAETAPQRYPLSKHEITCIDVLNLDGQVSNGGIEQWMYNGYAYRANETLEALRSVGANELERILEQALAVFPRVVRDRLMSQSHSGYLGWLELSIEDEERLDSLTRSYGNVRDRHWSLDDQLAEFARARRIGPATRDVVCRLPAVAGARVRK